MYILFSFVGVRKLNVIAKLEFELTDSYVADSHYTSGISPNKAINENDT